MIIESLRTLNLNQLPVFMAVFEAKSMSLAAKRLHLTQSGVSQHIRAVEDHLKTKLFERIRKRLIPTAAARALYEKCRENLGAISETFGTIGGETAELSGTAAIGMPVEFGTNVLMPLLGQFALKYPRVKLKLKLDFASVMNEALLSGELDFAFIDSFAMDRRIAVEKVYDEILELCILAKAMPKKSGPQNRAFFESLEYVEYQEQEPILRMWFQHHLGVKQMKLQVRAYVMDVQAVSRLIIAGAGAGVLPAHQIAKLEAEGHKLHRFKGCGKPVKNAISLAWIRERQLPRYAQEAIAWLRAI